ADERAHVRVHAPAHVDEEAALGRDRGVATEHVPERRHRRTLRVAALGDVRQLLRIAEQDQVAAARPDGQPVRQRDLARLVDEQRVDRALHPLAREEPRRPGHEQDVVGRVLAGVVRDVGDRAAVAERRRVRVLPSPRLYPVNATPSPRAIASISSSRLWIALWLGAVTPTRRPRAISATAMRAPAYVFPVPGGPWIASIERSSRRPR